MRPQIRLWSVTNGNLIQVSESSFSDDRKEKDLEKWVEQNPSLLGRELTVIGRQIFIPKVGPLDLLALDEGGRLVVVEFKRQQTTRDTIAQILDYASSVRRMNIEQLGSLQNVNPADLGEILDFDPAMILVAAEADEAAERIVEYLASKGQLSIEVVTFTYAKLDDGREIIARSILIPESTSAAGGTTNKITRSELFKIAEDRNVLSMVEILHKVTNLGWYEETYSTNGGKIRYSAETPNDGWRVLFGMSIGGVKQNSPEGTLDVWVRPAIVAEYAKLTLEAVLEQTAKFTVINRTDTRLDIRIPDQATASEMYSLLEKWASASAEADLTSSV